MNTRQLALKVTKEEQNVTRKVFFDGKAFDIDKEVYEPAEDTLLLASNLKPEKGDAVLDIGTGCGILAVLTASKAKHVVALDINPNAARCSHRNAKANGVSERLDVVCGDLFRPLRENVLFDLILFNAPYLPTEEDEQVDWVDYAWSGGRGGRETIDRFVADVSRHMNLKGRVLLVQSTLSGVERTLEELKAQGLMAGILAQREVAFETITLIEAVRTPHMRQAQGF